MRQVEALNYGGALNSIWDAIPRIRIAVPAFSVGESEEDSEVEHPDKKRVTKSELQSMFSGELTGWSQ